MSASPAIPPAPSVWEPTFRQLWDQALQRYRTGRRSPSSLVTPDDRAFLASIGCSAQDLFDFIEDLDRYGEPSLDTALAVQRIRFNYLTQVPASRPGVPAANANPLPAKSDAVEGIPWLPRLIAKARLKLRGELPDQFMYGCGGDRPFLQRAGLTLDGFLQLTWDSGSNDQPMIDAVRRGLGR